MNRLKTICSLIPSAAIIADIGCDHGLVSEFIVKNALAQLLIVNDISAQSLEKAKKRLALCDIQTQPENIRFYHCDGADLPDIGYDCVIIAGVGGREMLHILDGVCPESAVLAPQNYEEGVRKWIWEQGYRVEADMTVYDNHKFYDIIKIVYGGKKCPAPDKNELAYGYFYKQKNPVLLARLLQDREYVLSYKQTPENLEKLRIIEEALEWQR